MNRASTTILLLITLALCPLPVSGQAIEEPPFLPVIPEVMGRGGTAVAGAEGYSALFYNPAGFARAERSLTVSSATAWAYGSPARFLDTLGPNRGQSVTDFLNAEVTRGGVGYGASAGLGYVGGGLGLGLALMMDSYLYGSDLPSAVGDIGFTLGFVAGFALPVQLFGLRLDLGVDLRPMVRVRAPSVDYPTAFDFMKAIHDGGDPLAALSGTDALHGFGFGVDLGAIAELGSLRLGLSVRDFLGTRFNYSRNTVGGIMDSLETSFNLPTGTLVADEYTIPMNIGLGAAWHPDLGAAKAVIDPVFHADLQDVIGVFREDRSPWTLLHLGVEATLFSLLKLRAGLNQGALTFGGGLKILFLELDWAVFTREMGRFIGDRPGSGLTVEGAVRF